MKFTSEDLMKVMGLQVGDMVKFIVDDITYVGIVGFFENVISFIVEDKNNFENEVNAIFHLNFIIHKEVEFEILPRPKRVGYLKCEEIGQCKKCTLQWLCNAHYKYSNSGIKFDRNRTLYQILASYNIEDFDVYKVFKDRLDKEVEENDKR